ncbi:hypothetical protein HAX54_014864, partial [Datura stramonium]|nr:hypothetical protein [Datura stramonium]
MGKISVVSKQRPENDRCKAVAMRSVKIILERQTPEIGPNVNEKIPNLEEAREWSSTLSDS